MSQHIDQQELALYTTGGVEPARVREIEAHVELCDSCADSMQRESRLEGALRDMFAQTACPGCARAIATRPPEADRCTFCGAAARVGEYRVREIRVQNQHGRLYLAENAAGDQVALKELCFMQAPSFDALDAFDREARILCALQHPSMPRFISSFQAGEGVQTRLYLAQEFIHGESLEERLATHYYTEGEIVFVARQVLEILGFLQSKSPMVIHRDIKPANLIMRPDGKIVLVDFGAARDQGSTAGATQVGTFGFMPIEQLAGLVDATTDVYALGVSLLRLLTRREPWKLLDDPWKHTNVSPNLRRVIRKMTARKSEDRYQRAADALADMNSHALGAKRRQTPVAALGIGLSAMLAIGLGAVAMSGQDSSPTVRVVNPRPRPVPVDAPALKADEIEEMARGSSTTSVACFRRSENATDAILDADVTRVRLTFKVEPDGRVPESGVEIGVGSQALATCLSRMVAGWRFRPNPGGAFGFVLARPEVEADCDEVSCVLSNYEGPCCAKFNKSNTRVESDTTGLPEALDRTMIVQGVGPVKTRVLACGDKTQRKGLVKVSVKVKPDGNVGSVEVRQTPHQALGSCVATAMARARFARTQAGGTFSYPFVF